MDNGQISNVNRAAPYRDNTNNRDMQRFDVNHAQGSSYRDLASLSVPADTPRLDSCPASQTVQDVAPTALTQSAQLYTAQAQRKLTTLDHHFFQHNSRWNDGPVPLRPIAVLQNDCHHRWCPGHRRIDASSHPLHETNVISLSSSMIRYPSGGQTTEDAGYIEYMNTLRSRILHSAPSQRTILYSSLLDHRVLDVLQMLILRVPAPGEISLSQP